MRREVAADMKKSSRDFVRIVWPKVIGLVGGGDLIPVESVSATDFAAKLDQIAGIDAWIVQRRSHVFGLASRVQWPDGRAGWPYNTFTVRMRRPNGMPTEYEKRRNQIATSGSLYPRWTCQAFVRNEDLVSAAVVDTRHVIEAVTLGIGYGRRVYDGVELWAVPWQELWRRKCPSLQVVTEAGTYVRAAAS